MADKQEEERFSFSEMETAKALARVETLLAVNRDDFNEHKSDDDRNFSELFKANRLILKHIDEQPEQLLRCQESLRKEIATEVGKNFVTKIDYKVFVTKIYWGIAGGTTVASVLGFIVHLISESLRITGGG